MGLDYRMSLAWLTGGNTYHRTGGTTQSLTLTGTSANGGVINRYLLGCTWISTETSDLICLNGTAYGLWLSNTPADTLHDLKFPVAVKSSLGTALTIMVDSNDGTVNFMAYYK